MKILFVGDIFGSAGRRIVREHIGHVREAHDVELVVINAENAAGDMFGTDRLSDVLRKHPSACNSAQATVDAILAEVNAFQSGTAHFDDETLVVLRVL